MPHFWSGLKARSWSPLKGYKVKLLRELMAIGVGEHKHKEAGALTVRWFF